MDQSSGDMKPITTATIADIYVEQGLYDKALEVYCELLQDNPQDAAVQQKISELEALMKSGASMDSSSAQPQVDIATAAAGTPTTDVTTPAPHGVDSGTVIDKLNDWLASIQARRNRV
jgi:pentatricopeptide repeat protein